MPATDQADVWEKIAGINEEDRGDFDVEIVRILPTEDPLERVPYPISGECGSIPLATFNKDKAREKVGGGTYHILIRNKKTGKLFSKGKIEFPGAPILAVPGKQKQVKEKSSDITSQGSFEQGYRAAIEETERKSELSEIRKTINDLASTIRSHNGNGRKDSSSLTEMLEAFKLFKDVFNNGNGPQLDFFKMIQMLKEEREAGETKAFEISRLLAERKGDGSDEDRYLEHKVIDLVEDLYRRGSKRKQMDQAAKNFDNASQEAVKIFAEVRDKIADVLIKELGQLALIPAQTIRGSRSPDELVTAIEEVLYYIKPRGNVVAEEETDEDRDQPDLGSSEKDGGEVDS